MTVSRCTFSVALGIFSSAGHVGSSLISIRFSFHFYDGRMQFKIVFFGPRNERKNLSSISLLRLQLPVEISPRLFLFGNTFLRQRLSCQSTCQHFSLVRGIISQLCHKHFLLYQALYSNIPFYRQLLLKPVSL